MSGLLFALALFSTPTDSENFLDLLGQAEAGGRLTALQRLDLQETAVKNPSALPPPWRATLAAHPLPREASTAVLVDSFQERMHLGLRGLYTYPAELPNLLDSETFPIRVYYDDESVHSLALSVLAAAENSWQVQILDWGWYAPPLDTDEGRYRLYVTTSGMGGGGYTAPLGTWPETAWDDCVSYIVIDRSNDGQSVGAVVAHELNHAMQAAMDCMEPSAFWENSASYMMLAVYPGSIWYVRYFLESFQVAPQWSVSDGNQNSSYWYGGFIWPYFLVSQYGESWTDAIWLREVWERSMQSSNFTSNLPHYMTAIDDQLTEAGDGDLVSAFHAFSRARFFLDDRTHATYSVLPHAEQLAPTPTLTGNLFNDTEEQEYLPPKASWPKPYGVNYLILETPADYARNTTLEVVTTNDAPWHFQLITLSGDPEILEWDSTGQRTVFSFDPHPGVNQLLIIEHLGAASFHPNVLPAQGTEYKLYLRPTIGLPKITSVSPGSVYDGTEVTLNLYGQNFFENCSVTFFPAQDIEILEVTGSTEVNLKVKIRIARGAMLGEYGVSVTNTDGGSTRFDEAFTIVKNPSEPASDGCSCSQRSGRPAGLPWLLAPLLFFVLRRRLIP
ncbi:hypothetical protein KKD52_07060 [Myxococcota bacterium]|nr:hypothetical protein [Myxococcota bacterium]MBU1410026.1 hypothetical protein [Myxococcota bacterium]MBU1510104.1 hypothetical protein [Myxococcota bacterium]